MKFLSIFCYVVVVCVFVLMFATTHVNMNPQTEIFYKNFIIDYIAPLRGGILMPVLAAILIIFFINIRKK